jgi:hypothetical protein
MTAKSTAFWVAMPFSWKTKIKVSEKYIASSFREE